MDSLDELPADLRPSSVRRRSMRTIGLALVVVGCLLLVGAAVWWSLSLGDVGFALPSGTHYVSIALVGAVVFLHGLIAVVTVDEL